MIRSHFKNKKQLRKTILKKFTGDQLSSTDNIECFYCINLCYLSYVKCTRCKKTYCISHEVQCGCPIERLRIYERFSTEELIKFGEDAKKNITFPKKTRKGKSKKVNIFIKVSIWSKFGIENSLSNKFSFKVFHQNFPNLINFTYFSNSNFTDQFLNLIVIK